MERRQFLQATAATALMGTPGVAPAAAPKRRPNLLYVFDDQHRAQSLPGEPYSPVVAPTLAAFRKANFSMDHCVSNYPLCTPYRGILMTGKWPYQSGLWHNGANIRRDELSLGRLFKGQGYHTSYIGKWHLNAGEDGFIPKGPDRQGFDDWYVWQRTNNHYTCTTYDPDTGQKLNPKGWTPVLITDRAIDIIRKRPKDEPWMMMVSHNPPHPPYNPPEEDETGYPAAKLPMRPNVMLSMKGMANPVDALAGEAALRKAMVGYYGGITGIDTEFARVLKVLDETGQAENTIVIFTSDHGEMMGSQGRMQKNCPFEESVRVPFMVRYPGITKAGGKSDTLFAAIDIYPTLCGLAGIPVPKHCVGRDLSAVMRGQAVADAPKHVFLMNAGANNAEDEDDGAPKKKKPGQPSMGPNYVTLPFYRGIRTETHTYAVSDTGRWVLFDNVKDPYQMNNLIADPAQRGLMEQLDALIVAWLKAAGDPFPFAANTKRLATENIKRVAHTAS